MYILLINSNLKQGGGLQLANSICCRLEEKNSISLLFSHYIKETEEQFKELFNVEVYTYEVPNTIKTIVYGRDVFLDSLVIKKKVDTVLIIFGLFMWKPKAPHLVMLELSCFKRMDMKERYKWYLCCKIRTWSFRSSTNYFWTKNPYISHRLESLKGTRIDISKRTNNALLYCDLQLYFCCLCFDIEKRRFAA